MAANQIAANLLPRKGRNKPGREGEDLQRGVAGEADKYGCLAVDNIYNIMHTTDRKYLLHLSSKVYPLLTVILHSYCIPYQCSSGQ